MAHAQVAALKLREAPSESAEIKAIVGFKHPVAILEDQGSWVHVQIDGWVQQSGITTNQLPASPLMLQDYGQKIGVPVFRQTNGVTRPPALLPLTNDSATHPN